MTEQDLPAEIRALRSEIDELKTTIGDLVAAWNTAKGVVKFVRIIGSIGAGVATLWAFLRLVLHIRT